MGTYYRKKNGCPNCLTVERWLAEIRAIMPEHAAAIDRFQEVEEGGAAPAFVADGEVLLEWPITKRALLGMLQEQTRRMRA